MDYQFKYKLPDGLQVKTGTEKPPVIGQAKHAMLEGRPAGQAKPVPTRSANSKKSMSGRATRVAIISSAVLIIAGSAWYLFAPDSLAVNTHATASQMPARAGKVKTPAITSSLAPAAPEDLSAVAGAHASAPSVPDDLGPTAHRVSPAYHSSGIDAVPARNGSSYAGHTVPQVASAVTPAQGLDSARNTATYIAPSGDETRASLDEPANVVEPDPSRNRWRATKAENQSTPRRTTRPEARANARSGDIKGTARPSDRERLF